MRLIIPLSLIVTFGCATEQAHPDVQPASPVTIASAAQIEDMRQQSGLDQMREHCPPSVNTYRGAMQCATWAISLIGDAEAATKWYLLAYRLAPNRYEACEPIVGVLHNSPRPSADLQSVGVDPLVATRCSRAEVDAKVNKRSLRASCESACTPKTSCSSYSTFNKFTNSASGTGECTTAKDEDCLQHCANLYPQ